MTKDDRQTKDDKAEGTDDVDNDNDKGLNNDDEGEDEEEDEGEMMEEVLHVEDECPLWQISDGAGQSGSAHTWKLFDVIDWPQFDTTSEDSINATFPPPKVYLSDYWVARIMLSSLPG